MTVSVRSVLTTASLQELVDIRELEGLTGVARWQGWERARLLSFERDRCRVFLLDYEQEEMIPTDRVIIGCLSWARPELREPRVGNRPRPPGPWVFSR